MKLPILYSRTSKGQVQQWEIHFEKDSFWTVEGIQNGTLTTSKPTVCKPKNVGKSNETTPTEQAKLEAKAKWDKKFKTGYFENIADIDNQIYFEPMLAKGYEDFKDRIDWSKGVGFQIKYNGGRIVARKEGLFSRKGERYISIPHIEEALKPFFEKYPDAILDGEGFNYYLRQHLNEIISLLRKTVHATPEDLAKSKELIRFYIYDGFGIEGTKISDGYLVRKAAIDNYFKSWYKNASIVHEVPTWIVKSPEALEEVYQVFLEDGQEGGIIRILDVPYENKRSKYLLKYKPEDDSEFQIVDVIEGEGNRSGMAGKVECKMKDGTDRTFGCSMKGTEKQFKEVWENRKKYIGLTVTIYYHGFTGLGIPNYAKFDCDNWKKE